MGLHICNYCEEQENCKHKFEQDFLCKNPNINIKIEQENRYIKELKETEEMMKNINKIEHTISQEV